MHKTAPASSLRVQVPRRQFRLRVSAFPNDFWAKLLSVLAIFLSSARSAFSRLCTPSVACQETWDVQIHASTSLPRSSAHWRPAEGIEWHCTQTCSDDLLVGEQQESTAVLFKQQCQFSCSCCEGRPAVWKDVEVNYVWKAGCGQSEFTSHLTFQRSLHSYLSLQGTLSSRLVKKYDITSISTGDLLRQHISQKCVLQFYFISIINRNFGTEPKWAAKLKK